MRLINTRTLLLHDFVSDDSIPRYAILSHTWLEEEVSYQQWKDTPDTELAHLKGYRKIVDFCQRVAENGFAWGWVDTCCIDKTSSADLTEAINSMYKWYQLASVCYVYLADVDHVDSDEFTTQLRKSRWFTRGWTLQELIAPRRMYFFAADWTELGSKQKLLPLLADITKIDEFVLRTGDMSEASVAKKMSWASRRNTSRGEDKAYCLLGIFDVNMPLLYGEGSIKAFRRLQEAIMRITHDQSLFAWGKFVDNFNIIPPSALTAPWRPPEKQYGLFADSPADFSESSDVMPVDHGYAHIIDRARPPTVLHGGALVNLVVYKTRPCVRYWNDPKFTWQDEVEICVLMVHPNCDSDVRLVAIALRSWGDGYFSRTRELCGIKLFVSQYRFTAWTQQRHVLPPRPFQLVHGDIFFRIWDVDLDSAGFERPMLPSGPAWRMKWSDRVLRLCSRARGDEQARYRFKIEEGRYVSIGLRRLAAQTAASLGVLEIDVKTHVAVSEVPSFAAKAQRYQNMGGIGSMLHEMEQPEDMWRVDIETGIQLEFASRREALEDGGSVDVATFIVKRIDSMRHLGH